VIRAFVDDSAALSFPARNSERTRPALLGGMSQRLFNRLDSSPSRPGRHAARPVSTGGPNIASPGIFALSMNPCAAARRSPDAPGDRDGARRSRRERWGGDPALLRRAIAVGGEIGARLRSDSCRGTTHGAAGFAALGMPWCGGVDTPHCRDRRPHLRPQPALVVALTARAAHPGLGPPCAAVTTTSPTGALAALVVVDGPADPTPAATFWRPHRRRSRLRAPAACRRPGSRFS